MPARAREAIGEGGGTDLAKTPSAEGSASDEKPPQNGQADYDHALGITILTSKKGREGPIQREHGGQIRGGRKPNDGAPDEILGAEGESEPDQGEAPKGAGEEGQAGRGAGHGDAPMGGRGLEDQRFGQRAPEDEGMEVHGGCCPSMGEAPGSQAGGGRQRPLRRTRRA